MAARIFKKIENNMQQGRNNSDKWLLQHDVPHGWKPDPLTGWQGSGDTKGQVTLTFPDCGTAIRFAEAQGWEYRVVPKPVRKPRIQAYAENFTGGGAVSFDGE